MNLKQFIENNILVALFFALTAGFAAGWGAYVAIQNAAGLTSVSTDKLKELERRAMLGKEDIEKENIILRERITSLEAQNQNIHEALLMNRPTGRTYIKNVSISPKSPNILPDGKEIVVRYEYGIAENEKAYIFLIAELSQNEMMKKTKMGSALGTSIDLLPTEATKETVNRYVSLGEIESGVIFSGTLNIRSGTGSDAHGFNMHKSDIKAIHIIVISAFSGERLAKMIIPVQYKSK